MFKKPLFVSFTMTLLACAPFYFLGTVSDTQDFSLTASELPLFALALFIVILISGVWVQMGRTHTEAEQYQDHDDLPRESGNVKWFNASKGFGFITRDSGDDVFVHFRSIRGQGHRVLHDGQRVEFAVSEGEKGLQADDVAIAG